MTDTYFSELTEVVKTLRRLDPSREWGEDGKRVHFSFDGVCICYPTWDETGRFQVDPKAYYNLEPEPVAVMCLVNGESPEDEDE